MVASERQLGQQMPGLGAMIIGKPVHADAQGAALVEIGVRVELPGVTAVAEVLMDLIDTQFRCGPGQ
jgi:hypothetical protein